ncbi:MAG: hypothetical protein ACFNZW_00310 [Coriobacteriaceae bacterium]
MATPQNERSPSPTMLHLIPRTRSKATYEPIERYQSEADLLHDIAPAHRHAKAFYDLGCCYLQSDGTA